MNNDPQYTHAPATLSSNVEPAAQEALKAKISVETRMFSVVGLVIVLTFQAKTYAEMDLYNNNGWKPLSSEEALEHIHRQFVKTPDPMYSTTLYWSPTSLAEENIGNIEQNADVKPHDINRELMSNNYDDDIGVDEKQNQASLTNKKQNYNSEYISNDGNKTVIERVTGHRREAKNIMDNAKNEKIHIVHDYEKKNGVVISNILEDVKMDETNIITGKYNTYEVTEASEATDATNLFNVNHDRIIDKNKHYFERNFEIRKEKNLTNILLDILSNYNIKLNDDLRNYEISRNRQNYNAQKQSYAHSAPVRIPHTRNSQNHFPLDPFLAVLLSNYGYYLPGFYGFPGNYYNIYGYLASNNIHNNKPFGAYKIYSDTDSSH